MIALEVDGKPFVNFTSIAVNKSLEMISGTFVFQATITDNDQFPIKTGQLCRVIVDNSPSPIPIITGFVEIVEGQSDAASDTISIQGRDKTADLIDSTLTADQSDFPGPISLKKMAETAMQKAGITGIAVINNVTGLEDFKTSDFQASEVTETIFEFLERYARKRQVVLTSNGDGNLVITRSGQTKSPFKLIRLLEDTENQNTVLSSRYRSDISQRFNRYIVKSQINSSSAGLFDTTSAEDATNKEGRATDDEIRASRTLTIIHESSGDTKELQEMATWTARFRKSRGKPYGCNVQGFIVPNTQTTWEPNVLFDVTDEKYSVNEDLLLREVSYEFSLQSGSIVSLNFVPSNAYSVELERPIAEQQTSSFGSKFLIEDEPPQTYTEQDLQNQQ